MIWTLTKVPQFILRNWLIFIRCSLNIMVNKQVSLFLRTIIHYLKHIIQVMVDIYCCFSWIFLYVPMSSLTFFDRESIYDHHVNKSIDISCTRKSSTIPSRIHTHIRSITYPSIRFVACANIQCNENIHSNGAQNNAVCLSNWLVFWICIQLKLVFILAALENRIVKRTRVFPKTCPK